MEHGCAWESIADFGSPLLVVLHAIASLVLAGAATHNGLLSLRRLRGQPIKPVLHRVYGAAIFWAFLVTFVLGLVLYPRFRVDVRAGWLDGTFPLMTALFEIKEHWAAIGLGILLYYFPASRRIDEGDPEFGTPLFHLMGVLLMCIVWVAALTGLGVTALDRA